MHADGPENERLITSVAGQKRAPDQRSEVPTLDPRHRRLSDPPGYHTETDQAQRSRQQLNGLLSPARVDWLTSEVVKLTTKQRAMTSTVHDLRDQAEQLSVLVDKMDWRMKTARRFVGKGAARIPLAQMATPEVTPPTSLGDVQEDTSVPSSEATLPDPWKLWNDAGLLTASSQASVGNWEQGEIVEPSLGAQHDHTDGSQLLLGDAAVLGLQSGKGKPSGAGSRQETAA